MTKATFDSFVAKLDAQAAVIAELEAFMAGLGKDDPAQVAQVEDKITSNTARVAAVFTPPA